MRSFSILLLILILRAPVLVAEIIGFNEHIRPILNRSCTGCHGGVVKEGKVSFIYREEALGKGSSGKFVIVPGHPEKSEMYRRIVTSDSDDLMPPPDKPHSKPLNKQEIQYIKKWIAQGANWEKHWAYEIPKKRSPVIQQTQWPRQEMDRYILSRLEKNQLSPNREAEKSQWLRRVSFDLIGLPPSLKLLNQFEQDHSSKAYENIVDQLLASPRFGERWAAVWLDLARYSDTMGYEKDPHRDIWPYRDWVIRAFNNDLPYDLFLRDQLAGDLLESPTADQLLATAFHRNSQTNTEGGTDDEEFRVISTIDRVNTTWTAMQGLTFGCTQCHSHPYEPIPHMDYYKFKDYFNNLEDSDLSSEFPKMLVAHDAADRDRAVIIEKSIQNSLIKRNNLGKTLLNTDQWNTLKFDTLQATSGEIAQINGVVHATGTHQVRTSYKLRSVIKELSALRFTIIPSQTDPKKLPERGAVLSHIELHKILPDGTKKIIPLKHLFADSLSGPMPALESLKKGRQGWGGYPKLFGTRNAAFVPATALSLNRDEQLEITIHQQASTAGSQAVTIRNFTIEASQNPRWQEILNSAKFTQLTKRLQSEMTSLSAIKGTKVPIMRNRDPAIARETRLFLKGLWIDKAELAKKDVPKILNSYGAPASNRLEMARWMTHPENPLTARVMANRLFAEIFGKGIVETLGDFGSTGLKPTNLALLDYLALKFQHQYSWSVKKLLKELVLSATYRQDHRSTPELSKLDPRNALLARGPRNRLSAEMIRDNALAASGLIQLQLGGPSVMPPQPDGVWQSVYSGAKWKTASGPNRYRRAIYTYWKRTSPYPSMLTFDTPTRDVCAPQRIATNTPLHALVTLNDPVFLECSQALAKKMQAAHPDSLKLQLKFGYKLCTQKEITKQTLDTLIKLHNKLSHTYQTEEYSNLASSASGAAAVVLANALLNIDDAISK